MQIRSAIFAIALSACNRVESICALPPPNPDGELVILQSDYISTRVVLSNADGEVVDSIFLSSGTCVSGLVSSLSGDVVLPTQPFANHLAFIDRRNTDVLTLVANNGSVRQFDLRQERGPGQVRTGASTNAMDAISIATNRGIEYWISRHDPNRSPLARVENRGDDILVLNGDGNFVTSIVCDDSNVGNTAILARPEKLVSFTDRDGKAWVLVALARLSENFSVAGPAAVCLIDPESYESRTFELSILDPRLREMTNCGLVHATQTEAVSSLAVLCRGATFAGVEERRRSAGLVSFRLENGLPLVHFVWRASDFPQMPVPSGSVLMLGPDTVLAVSRADAGGHDRWVKYSVAEDRETTTFEILYEAQNAFVLGDGSARQVSATETRVYLPDAEHNTLLLRDWRRDAHGVWRSEPERTSSLPSGSLPARVVAWASD